MLLLSIAAHFAIFVVLIYINFIDNMIFCTILSIPFCYFYSGDILQIGTTLQQEIEILSTFQLHSKKNVWQLLLIPMAEDIQQHVSIPRAIECIVIILR